MTKNLIIATCSEEEQWTLDEVCSQQHITVEFVCELIDYSVVHPSGDLQEQWQFSVVHLQKIQTASRLKRDLGLNVAGIAVVLDLMDELEELRAKNDLLEKYLLR